MAYELDAVIGRQSTIDAVIQELSGAQCVRLTQGVAMIPLTEELLGELRRAHGGGEPQPDRHDLGVKAAVAGWVRAASRHGLLAHCSAAYVGGMGAQSAVIWHDGSEIERCDSVNRALSLLGVTCDEGEDEWDTAGLGRFRQTDRWLAVATTRVPGTTGC